MSVAALLYAVLLMVLWREFVRSPFAASHAVTFPRAFASFAILFAPLWFFGFGAADAFTRLPLWSRVTAAATLAIPYFVLTLGTTAFGLPSALVTIALPVTLAGLSATQNSPKQISWRDAVVLALVVAVYFMKLLQPAWDVSAVTFFPKLFLADVVLYVYLVVRKLDGTGYSLIPTRSALLVGSREWAFYLPLAFVIGELTGFIHFHARLISLGQIIGGILATFLLIAIPEELFFRAILQNLLETRFGRLRALVIAAILFGLSHFNHGPTFNWRYVLLASLAGIFYGRAWRANRQIFASVVTHTAVDVVWSFWFR